MNTHSFSKSVLAVLVLACLTISPASTGFAQGTTAFTYQGQLRDGGTNANGNYALTFKLYNAAGGGSQVGGALTAPSQLLVNGLFSVNLDFGAGAFGGNARWLEISVSNSVTTLFETLVPRVQILPAPYALYAGVAGTVTNGAIMNAQLAGNAVATANIQNNAVTTAQIASGQVVKSLNGLTDFVALAAGTNITLTTNGTVLQVSAIPGVVSMQVFYTSGTFMVPTNVTKVMVELWGGGGGGGMGINDRDSQGRLYTGGGGGGAEYVKATIGVTPGTSYAVTVGQGGSGGVAAASNGSSGQSSSLGGFVTATGGGAGTGAPNYFGGFGGSNGNQDPQTHRVSGSNGQTYYDGKSGGSAAAGGFAWGGNSGGTSGAEPGGGGNGDGGRGGNGRVIVYY